MNLLEWLLVGIGVLLLLVVSQLSALATLVRNLAVGLGQDIAGAREQRDQLNRDIDELKDKTEEIRSHIEDIAGVMRIVEKYKLPNRRERKELDEIAMESEFYDIVSKREPKA